MTTVKRALKSDLLSHRATADNENILDVVDLHKVSPYFSHSTCSCPMTTVGVAGFVARIAEGTEV
jgi:hypothetical protein